MLATSHVPRSLTYSHPGVTDRHELHEPLKLLYIISDLSIGGAEMALFRLLEKTDLRRFEPIVVSLINQGCLSQQIEALGIPVHTLGMKPGKPSLVGLCRLVALINKLEPKLIVGWMHHSCVAAEVANWFTRRRVPTVWSLHYAMTAGSGLTKLTAAVLKTGRVLSRFPSRIIYVSKTGERHHERASYQMDRSCVIPNGIDVKRFKPSQQARTAVRNELGLSEHEVLIGLVGRYHPMKDHANFLKAASLIAKNYPKVHFVLIGRGVDKDNQNLQSTIDLLNLRGRVHLLGERHDTDVLSGALDIFSLSSYDESCPNVIGESMACGVPCVVTDVGDAGYLVGDTGTLVPPRDSSALARAWEEMLAIAPHERRELGQRARARILERFPIERIAQEYGSLFEAVVAESIAVHSHGIVTPDMDGRSRPLESRT
jgi:glycosyltransferase involved in cell wall biosynthesis